MWSMDVYLKAWLLLWRGGSNLSLRAEGSSRRSGSRRSRQLLHDMGSISHRFTTPMDQWRTDFIAIRMGLRRKEYEHSCMDQPIGTEFRCGHRLENSHTVLVCGGRHRPIGIRVYRSEFLWSCGCAREFAGVEQNPSP